LTVDIINAVNPWVCDVSEKEDCRMVGVHSSK
jgi:hypothetical protein